MSAEERTGSPGGGSLPPRGSGWRTVPLNSRRVTAPILRCVAVNLGVPTSASAEELRQMIDDRARAQAARRAGSDRARRYRRTRTCAATRQ